MEELLSFFSVSHHHQLPRRTQHGSAAFPHLNEGRDKRSPQAACPTPTLTPAPAPAPVRSRSPSGPAAAGAQPHGRAPCRPTAAHSSARPTGPAVAQPAPPPHTHSPPGGTCAPRVSPRPLSCPWRSCSRMLVGAPRRRRPPGPGPTAAMAAAPLGPRQTGSAPSPAALYGAARGTFAAPPSGRGALCGKRLSAEHAGKCSPGRCTHARCAGKERGSGSAGGSCVGAGVCPSVRL